MFQLAAFTDEISQDFEHAVAVCQEYGVPAVEIRSVWQKKGPQDLLDGELARMLDILGAARMTTACIASPFLKCDLGDEDAYRAHLGILRRCCQVARMMGTDIIRGFTFWKTGPAQAVWQQLLDAYSEPIRICEQEDVYIGIENEASTHIATAAEAEAMYKDLASDRVRAIWDPANEVYAADGELPFPNAFERMKPFMIHMHIKDAVRDAQAEGGARCVPVGDGGYIDYPAQFQALVDMGYEGACSLETHWRPDSQLDEETMNKPGGAAFSAGGEQASRICFEKILGMVANLKS